MTTYYSHIRMAKADLREELEWLSSQPNKEHRELSVAKWLGVLERLQQEIEADDAL